MKQSGAGNGAAFSVLQTHAFRVPLNSKDWEPFVDKSLRNPVGGSLNDLQILTGVVDTLMVGRIYFKISTV